MDKKIERPSEGGIEGSMLKWFKELDWDVYGSKEREGANILDQKYDRRKNEVIYWDILKEKVKELNEEIDDRREGRDNLDDFISSLRRDLSHDNLMDGNEKFYRILRRGKKFTITREDGSTEAVYIQLIDFDDIEKNEFIAVNQFRVSRKYSIRPDITLFINGIPIIEIELKSLAQDNDYEDAIDDLKQYEGQVPRLFVPALLNAAADTVEFRYGGVGVPKEYYMPWSEAPEEYQSKNKMKQAVQAIFNHETLLDVLNYFVFYKKKTGRDVKVVPRHMQYYATKKILEHIKKGEGKRGLIWHAQGSGKSYTMLYTAWNLLKRKILDNPQIIIIVDREKLEEQMGKTLANIGFGSYEVADNIDHLQRLIENGASKVVLTTIQKFQDVEPEIQGNPETVILTDEAHRYMQGDLESMLKAALTDAYHFGFTGTPVRESERNTFENYHFDTIHRYSMREGQEDGVILPVHFNIRQIDWEINEKKLDLEFEGSFNDLPISKKQKIIREYVTQAEISELRPRIEEIAKDIAEHYRKNVEKNGWKGMVVTPRRKAAALYGEELRKLLDKEEVEVLITAGSDDESIIRKYHTTPREREKIVERFKKEENPKLLVVCDMLLTGFDAPILKTIYLDRNLKNHSLLQAIARTNRPAENKHNGEIVDYQGVFRNIDDALDYNKEVQHYAARDKEELFEDFKEQLNDLMEIFEGIPKKDTQEVREKCLARVTKPPHKRDFKRGFKELQNTYESISPYGPLVTSGLLEKYKWLNCIYIAFRRITRGDENPEEELREKTKEIIEDNVEVKEVKKGFPVYKISKEELGKIREIEPAAKASGMAHAGQKHLQPRVDKNPKYKKLSERLNELVNAWQSGEISDPKAVKKLEKVEKEIIEVDEAPEKRGMSKAEYAIYSSLMDNYEEYIESEEKAKEIANSIVEEFKENVDRSFENWKVSESTRKQIRKVLIQVILFEYEKKGLFKNKNFIEDATNYLLANYE